MFEVDYMLVDNKRGPISPVKTRLGRTTNQLKPTVASSSGSATYATRRHGARRRKYLLKLALAWHCSTKHEDSLAVADEPGSLPRTLFSFFAAMASVQPALTMTTKK